MNSQYKTVTYERLDCHIARIMLNKPETANAQCTRLLYELNDALDRASHDDTIKVIVLGAHGRHFSSGHDLTEKDVYNNMNEHATVGPFCCFDAAGIEGHMSREEEIYLGFCERWRNIPKPTIAVVQGKCIAGGLMLIWPCDLIIASEDATFCDPTLSFGVPGVEYFMMPWELGVRKAKELLYTAGEISATDASALGMINKVVAREALMDETMLLAKRISKQSSFALKLAKQSLNHAEDVQGRTENLRQAFTSHQLSHAHNLHQFNTLLNPSRLPKKTQNVMKKS